MDDSLMTDGAGVRWRWDASDSLVGLPVNPEYSIMSDSETAPPGVGLALGSALARMPMECCPLASSQGGSRNRGYVRPASRAANSGLWLR